MTSEPGAAWRVWSLALWLFAATDPIYPLLIRGPIDWGADYDAVASSRRVVWAGLYLCAAGALWAWRREALALLSSYAVLPIALIWFAASCLWAHSPLDSAVGYAQFVLLFVAGAAVAGRIGAPGIVMAVGRAALVAMAASALMAVASPPHAFGQQVNVGALRGVYIEKNHLATIASFGIAAWLFEAFAGPRSRRAIVAALFLLIGLVMARSSIALLQVVWVVALALALGGFAKARFGGAALAAFAVAGLCALVAVLPVALTALGEDATLNGRTVLWSALWPHVEARPLAGHGFFAFWTTPAAEAMRDALGWNARGSHNGWITALLHGGAVGAALWIAHWLDVLRRAMPALKPSSASGPGANAWRAGLAVLTLVHLVWSLFESNQLAQMNVHALIAGLCLASARSPIDGRSARDVPASRAARTRNFGLPTT